MTWLDVTKYTKYDTTPTEPREWALDFPKCTLRIYRHIDTPGRWMVECPGICKDVVLKALTADDAKRNALGMYKMRITEIAKCITDFEGVVSK